VSGVRDKVQLCHACIVCSIHEDAAEGLFCMLAVTHACGAVQGDMP